MKRIICIIGLLVATSGLHAQPAQRHDGAGQMPRRERQGAGQRGARVQALKVGYLTEKLQLSPAQAASFWPVYNEYEQELQQTRKSLRQKYGRDGIKSDADAERRIEAGLDLQEQMIDIKRKYKDRFLNVISARQLATMYESEREFRQLLLKQLRERRGRRMQGDN